MTAPHSLKLVPDAPVPDLVVPCVGGETFTLNDVPPTTFTMLVFYRGYHCPVCRTYLTGLAGLSEGYRDAGFDLIALSMDDAERAARTVAEWETGDIAVGHSLDEATARAWGLWLTAANSPSEPTVFCEPGVFWVRPDGRLFLASISNMPWPRPDLAAMLAKIPLIQERNYPARGTHLG